MYAEDKENKGIIYRYISPSGKSYIGLTIRLSRWANISVNYSFIFFIFSIHSYYELSETYSGSLVSYIFKCIKTLDTRDPEYVSLNS